MQRYIKILFSIIFRDNFIPKNKKIGIWNEEARNEYNKENKIEEDVENVDDNYSDEEIKGTLEDTDGDGKVTVNVINTGGDAETGRLKITKVINDEALTNQDYVFKVKVTGTFENNGTSYEDETLDTSKRSDEKASPNIID